MVGKYEYFRGTARPVNADVGARNNMTTDLARDKRITLYKLGFLLLSIAIICVCSISYLWIRDLHHKVTAADVRNHHLQQQSSKEIADLKSKVAALASHPIPATAKAVETAIRSGLLGPDIAKEATQEGDLHLSEIESPGIPFKMYHFGTNSVGRTVMIENNRLILLCAAFGGGIAHNFAIRKDGEKEILSYNFDTGSGRLIIEKGEYILGSGSAATLIRTEPAPTSR